MVGDAYLTTDYNIIFHHGAAGEPGLRRDDHIFSNLYVVANMHQVVDLRPASDARNIQRSAVNGCVSSDLDVVFNFQSADLRELLIASGLLIAHIAESVTPQHRARVNNYSITNANARIDGYVRIQFAVSSDHDVGSHHTSRPDSRVVADLHTLAEHHISAHIYTCAGPNLRGHNGSRMNSSLMLPRCSEQTRRASECPPRVRTD